MAKATMAMAMATATMMTARAIVKKTPSQMDVAPWDDHWIKMVLDGI